ncbi:single-stranded-DNA-specific exonuclease RecJ [Paenibacillus sp. 481]|uniref:single-stranded-DNA-specific exonuclease RecJ n=1 Tax=Paenibacillus sp. 481 TaxID=2835869 RepID=UPI001E49F2BE|nr:single-stranded-DNA-specific exonuclease RecJ [Paenibacillus sp. 481]UHA74323.1 single-stranded-DNA-specific exonuclease RecJ [Paenibacillus sp. 481]
MLQPRTRWICAESSDTVAQQLAEQANISPLLAKMLVVRGIRDKDQVHRFLYADTNELHDPYLLAGMESAVARIQTAIAEQEHIRIYGDYDADGVSSTSLMIHLMRMLGAKFDYYIPHRSKEGYGLNNAAIDDAKSCGTNLIITVDTGISAVEQIAYARELGIDVVVTDHHEPPEHLPEAYVIVNPKLSYCTYPFKGLAGVGVAFKLAHALLGRLPEELLELAAIGTVADLMPLVDENRIIVRAALEHMKQSRYAGIRALLEIGNVNLSELTSTHIAFSMAPRINASGRLDHANIAVELLTTNDAATARTCAEELDRLNRERQKIVETIVKEAEAQLQAKIEQQGVPDVIVLAAEGWNVGVIGIVASKILERYYRPTFVLGIDAETGKCKGSARSIAGFDLYEAMTECSDLFEHFGGHQAAAGMTLHRDQLLQLEAQLNEIAQRTLTAEHYVPRIEVDAECSMSEVPLDVIEQLGRLAPFGMGNPSPRIVIRGAIVQDKRTMGKDGQHLKLMLAQDRATLDAVAFQRGAWSERIALSSVVDVLGELSINEWNGNRKAQLMLQDMHIAHQQLFDLRGAQDALKTAVEQARRMAEPNRCALLMTREQAGVFAAEPFVWLYSDEITGPVARPAQRVWDADDSLEEQLSAAVTDLIICGIPPSLDEAKRIAQQFSQTERVHVTLPRQPEGGRLLEPNRDRIKAIFGELRRLQEWKSDATFIQSMSSRCRMSPREFLLLLDVFEELQFVTCTRSHNEKTYQMVLQPQKTSLDASQRYQDWAMAYSWEHRWYDSSTESLATWLWSLWEAPAHRATN